MFIHDIIKIMYTAIGYLPNYPHYLISDEEIAKRVEIVEEKNKAYIEGFGYVAPSKTQTIIVDSDGDINKMVGTME